MTKYNTCDISIFLIRNIPKEARNKSEQQDQGIFINDVNKTIKNSS